MSKQRNQLFVCGDLCNLGDLALLLQNLEIARRDGRDAVVRRWAPIPDEIVTQVEAAGGRLLNGQDLRSFLAVAVRSDMVIGGGQLIRDNVSLRSLLFLVAGTLAVRRGGGMISTRGLGVSIIRDVKRAFLWRQVLKRAEDIRVRDLASRTNALELLPKAKVRLTADMAFLPSALHAHAAGRSGGQRILIAPCIDGSENRDMDGPVLKQLVDAARRRFPDAEIVFACHDPRPGMDGFAADTLIRSLGLASSRKFDGYDLRGLLAEYQGAALVITNRLHSVIFSLLMRKPVLVVSDGAKKIEAVASQFSVPLVSLGANNADSAVDAALTGDANVREAALSKMADLAALNIGRWAA